jgi:hypothetical protein
MDSVLLKGLLVSNQQAYCCNNPVLHTDSNGRNFLEDLWNLFSDTVNANQEIAQYNAQAEHEAWQAAGEAIGNAASAGWKLFVDTVNENQRVAQMNAQAELEANRAIAKSLWNLFVMTVEENQKIAQQNTAAEHEARKEFLFWIDGIPESLMDMWNWGTWGVSGVNIVASQVAAEGIVATSSGVLSVIGWGITGLFLYADLMTDMWRNAE